MTNVEEHQSEGRQPDDDGIDRRGFIRCMAWAGTGLLWTVQSGVPKSMSLGAIRRFGIPDDFRGELYFAQISDSHIGFNKAANPDVTATLQEAVARLNALKPNPAFVLHTGDISHLSKPSEFDTADQVLRSVKTDRIHFVPGEHDVLTDNGRMYLDRYGKGSKGAGWYSFDQAGVHFIGLVNVVDLQAGGLGKLGAEQLAWLKDDVRRLSSSTPIVVFAHIPLWTVYAEWGWGTDDSTQALALLKRFGSVTVLNGHIHQTLQKVEGNVTFHTAMSTAFVQPKPGTAPSPGPMKVDPGQLRNLLGITSVELETRPGALAEVTDRPLAAAGAMMTGAMKDGSMKGGMKDGSMKDDSMKGESMRASSGSMKDGMMGSGTTVKMDNFAFSPTEITITAGGTVTWVNGDDVPHKIVSSDRKFDASPVLDTDQKYSQRFDTPGRYPYFCALHPKMVGAIVVKRG